MAFNAEYKKRIRNILPIVYSKNYDLKGVSKSSQPQNPKLGAYGGYQYHLTSRVPNDALETTLVFIRKSLCLIIRYHLLRF